MDVKLALISEDARETTEIFIIGEWHRRVSLVDDLYVFVSVSNLNVYLNTKYILLVAVINDEITFVSIRTIKCM